ncbi:NAD-dependent epimerase/dehydratase family protein [Pedobacter arcticus]|uniref:NAD-dependent epimerase/dehydratase family protein n=1 Tax=Pedobacter arcticus TaxID=752140 RepID=UPI0002F659B0|nr:NAD-dependent epimerase/dehydratase family protein [Pedobacter arcticus]
MILVTGGTGFLGAELVFRLLQTEEKVRCIKREDSVIPEKLIPFSVRIEWLNADILDFSDLEDAFEDITQVYHCAALVSFDESLKTEMLQVNAEGTANVVTLCVKNEIEKLVYVSSIAALGSAKADGLINEACFWEGFEIKDAYAVSKYRAEMEVWRGINEGLNAVIVNPSVIIGADAGTSGSGAIFESVKNGLSYYTRGATGFVDVEDVTNCMILLMNNPVKQERFILNAENITYQNLFEQTARAFGIAEPHKLAKPWMLNFAWRFTSFKNLFLGKKGGINKTVAKTANKVSQYDNQKIKTLLNYEFIPLKQSIIEIAKALKSA